MADDAVGVGREAADVDGGQDSGRRVARWEGLILFAVYFVYVARLLAAG